MFVIINTFSDRCTEEASLKSISIYRDMELHNRCDEDS
jgi:hypothetical protein